MPLYAIIAGLAYLLTSAADPVPEVTYPHFLQHMLQAGEVGVASVVGVACASRCHASFQVQRLEVSSAQDRVYVYLHHGAIINGREVCAHAHHWCSSI